MCILNSLIDENTGEIDSLVIAEAAGLRACREYGSSNPPPAYHRNALQWTLDRAQAMRTAWRRDRGLRDDTGFTMSEVPSWGAGGDSFGAR